MADIIPFPKKNARLEYETAYLTAVTLSKDFMYMRTLLNRLREESYMYRPAPKSRLDELDNSGNSPTNETQN